MIYRFLLAVGLVFTLSLAHIPSATSNVGTVTVKEPAPVGDCSVSDAMTLAQGKSISNPCSLNGRVPCGSTCCPKGYRCGDSKCHKRSVKGNVGSGPGTAQTQ